MLTVDGICPHVEGNDNTVSGRDAQVSGSNNTVTGFEASANGGQNNTVNGLPTAIQEEQRRLPHQEQQIQQSQQQQVHREPIKLSLRGQDEAFTNDNNNLGEECRCCQVNKAVVASVCCGKVDHLYRLSPPAVRRKADW